MSFGYVHSLPLLASNCVPLMLTMSVFLFHSYPSFLKKNKGKTLKFRVSVTELSDLNTSFRNGLQKKKKKKKKKKRILLAELRSDIFTNFYVELLVYPKEKKTKKTKTKKKEQ